ncbi:MAG TPA: PPC domain-containing protein, partial [Verrucomicrobiae bacterium]|nr:PPC domain-containing protein [Verrucomicrobiae bacterium]
MRKMQDNCPGKPLSWAGLVKLGLVAFIGLVAAASWAQPANDLFDNSIDLGGTATGTTNGSNLGATAEAGEPDHADNPGGPYSSVWYQWTAGNDAVLEFDTEGSDFDTEIAVYAYTGTDVAAVTNLTLIAQNEDVDFPNDLASKVTFTVTAGTTYYIAVDGYQGSQGNVTLNWNTLNASYNAGQFQFASGMTAQDISGAPFYLASDDESFGPIPPADFMAYSPPRMTVTRVGGHAGRVQAYYLVTNAFYTNLIYTNIFGTNFLYTNGSFYTNIFYTNIEVINVLQQMDKHGHFIYLHITNDTAIFGTNQDSGLNTVTTTNLGTNFSYFCSNASLKDPSNAPPKNVILTNYFCTNYPAYTNLIPTAIEGQDYFLTGASMLDFLDYQMSGDINNVFINPFSSLSPFFTVDGIGPFYLNRFLVVTITNVVFDPQETTNIGPPTISTTMATAYMNILDFNALGTNAFYGDSGDVWNFDHVTYRFKEGNGGIARIWVTWSGTNNGPPKTETLNFHLDFGSAPDNNDSFPLLPGSDYATPPNPVPGSSQPADFTDTSGSFTWTPNAPYFDIPIVNDNIVEFNEDIWMELYAPSSGTMG